MPVDWSKYPETWLQTAFRIKNEVDWKCQKCGMQCRRAGEVFTTHKLTLTVAHINHVESDCRDENLVALCAGCHLRYDSQRKVMQRLAAKRVAAAMRSETNEADNE